MNAKEIIKTLMNEKEVTNADMAGALNISQAALWDRLNPNKTNNMTVNKLNSMLRYLGYDLVIIPRGRAGRLDGSYVVTDTEPASKTKPNFNLDELLSK